MRAPDFWFSKRLTLINYALMPSSWIYRGVAWLKSVLARPHKVDTSVICIGNFVAGGAGKTPTALALCALLQQKSKRLSFLTRGHGSSAQGLLHVDADEHTSQDVGDEALLLAGRAPTLVAKDRVAGAEALSVAGDTDIILMDDGFQNLALHKDLSFIVIDHNQGIGNGCVIPAGPLRGSLHSQIIQADAFIIVGGELADKKLAATLRESGKPVFTALIEPSLNAPDIKTQKVVAYTGIGIPDKFFTSLRNAGADIIEEIRFPDHYNFTEDDARWLLALQQDTPGCLLMTTEKDHIRLKKNDRTARGAISDKHALPCCLKV